jgi:hypothetical protein
MNALDAIEAALTIILGGIAFCWRPYLAPAAARLAEKPRTCVALITALPLVLRFALLATHPVPTPSNYDEFSHLLVADTLLNGRLANPAHAFGRFFETFFVLQEPTYSSIYPIGLGFSMAVGRLLFGLPWAGVLLTTASFAAACYWMLRGWTTPGWALAGGVLAALSFGPLSPWMNTYWGGSWTATGGCLVFGALPRLREGACLRDGILLGTGIGMHLLSRPFETVFLVLGVAIYYLLPRSFSALSGPTLPGRPLAAAGLIVLGAVGITLLQNKRVTGEWLTSPYLVSQYQYGVPAPLTFQANPVPHRQLTPGQERDYQMQAGFRSAWFPRLATRVRSYRFFFYPPLYLALAAFLFTLLFTLPGEPRSRYIALVCLLFALGTNFFPAFRYHYVAGVVCLFMLMAVEGLRAMPAPAARWLLTFTFLHFAFWYGAHASESSLTVWDAWNGVNHLNSQRTEVASELASVPGDLLVFVRYWPAHIFQDEWVWNDADIDRSRVIVARDLGDNENLQLVRNYQGRTVLLLEPDAKPARLSAWAPEPTTPVTPVPSPAPPKTQRDPFEPVR